MLKEKKPDAQVVPHDPSVWMYLAAAGQLETHYWKEPFVKTRSVVGHEASQVRNVSDTWTCWRNGQLLKFPGVSQTWLPFSRDAFKYPQVETQLWVALLRKVLEGHEAAHLSNDEL